MKFFLLVVVAAAAVTACSSSLRSKGLVPTGTANPDQFLFDRGTKALNDKKWLTAREYFKELVETYTQSPFRPDAKLGMGDTYLGEGTSEALVLAINEFREFLTYYPTNRRADYAQYKMALAHFRQMKAPQRDQTETRNAVHEFEVFLDRYPNSTLAPDVKDHLREARNRLSEADYEVGFFYFRQRWYPGAADRFLTVLKDDPDFKNRDAVYFYLAELYLKTNQKARALPYYEKLVEEFQQSDYLRDARKRIEELRSTPETKAAGG